LQAHSTKKKGGFSLSKGALKLFSLHPHSGWFIVFLVLMHQEQLTEVGK
jgi:hypothetical protein